MANFKNSVEAEFQNSSINLINSNYILSVDLTEGISIPFVLNIEFLTDTKQKISTLKALLDQAVTVTMYQYSSDKSIAKSYVRDVHGVVTAFEDHGVYNIDNGNAKRMYRYTLTVMPEIVRLSSKSHQRSFTDKSVVQVIDSILGEYGIQSDSNNNNLWTDRPDNTSLVFTQTKETDLEFLNKLCSDFGINYTVEYDRKSRNNIYSFSRGYITRKDSSVALNVSMTLNDKLSFFDQHVVDDIVTSCAVAYEDKSNDEKRDFTYDFNFLFNDVDSDKKRKSIRDFCSKSRQAFKDNLNEKTLVRANDLSYVPGVMLQVKDYDDSATYTIARTCLKIYSLEQDPKLGNFAFRQTLLCLNKLNKELLGSVYQLPRINLDSSLADIRIHEDPQIGHDSEFYSSSVNDYSFCVGTVSNESGEIRDKDGRDVVPASGGNGSVPTKFYLKTDSSDVPAVVHYLHSQSGINNYLSDFPKLGQKVVALKLGGNYLFYAYLPHSNDIESLIPNTYGLHTTAIYEPNGTQNRTVADHDINNYGLKFTRYTSVKEKVISNILQGSVDAFIDSCVCRLNDVNILNRYSKPDTVTLSDGTKLSCKDACTELVSKLKSARVAYLKEKDKDENSSELENRKKDIITVYGDVEKTADQLIAIVGTKQIESITFSGTEISSSGDLKLSAQGSLEISAKSITIKSDEDISVQSDRALTLNGVRSLTAASGCSQLYLVPHKANLRVRRIWLADISYDSSINLEQNVSISGYKVGVNSLISSTMKDAFGGCVQTSRGESSILGTNIVAKTRSKTEIGCSLVQLGLELRSLLNIISGIEKTDESKLKVKACNQIVGSTYDVVNSIIDLYNTLTSEDGTNQVVYTVSLILDTLDVIQGLYRITEGFVVLELGDSEAVQNYLRHADKWNYMRARDWIEFGFFSARVTLELTSAVTKSVLFYKNNPEDKRSSLSISPKEVKIESTKTDFEVESLIKNNSPLDGNGVALDQNQQIPENGNNNNADENDPNNIAEQHEPDNVSNNNGEQREPDNGSNNNGEQRNSAQDSNNAGNQNLDNDPNNGSSTNTTQSNDNHSNVQQNHEEQPNGQHNETSNSGSSDNGSSASTNINNGEEVNTRTDESDHKTDNNSNEKRLDHGDES